MQLKNLNENSVKESSANSKKTQNSDNNDNNDNNTVNTKLNEDSLDDEFPSDSDSDPIFSINAQSAAAQQAQSSSCWDGIVSIFSSCFAQKTTTLEFGALHIISMKYIYIYNA